MPPGIEQKDFCVKKAPQEKEYGKQGKPKL